MITHKNPTTIDSTFFRMTTFVFIIASSLALLLAFLQPPLAAGNAPRIENAMTLHSLPENASGMTLSLTKVHSDPDASSRVVDILTPQRPVQVLGFSADNRWAALGTAGQSQPSGWISRGEVALARTYGFTQGLTLVFAAPIRNASTLDIFTPGARVELAGMTLDGEYYALRLAGASQSTGYVPVHLVSQEAQTAVTVLLTKVYQSADETSPVVTILTPAQEVQVLNGAAPEGWIAITKDNLAGYARLSDLKIHPAPVIVNTGQ